MEEPGGLQQSMGLQKLDMTERLNNNNPPPYPRLFTWCLAPGTYTMFTEWTKRWMNGCMNEYFQENILSVS